MRIHRKITAGIVGLAGLLTGLLAGSAFVAWVLRSPPPRGRRRLALPVAPQSCDESEADAVRAQIGAGGHLPPNPARDVPLLESLSPKPRTRVLPFAVAMGLLAVGATGAGLVGSAHAKSSSHRKMATALTGGDPDRGKDRIEHYGCSSCHTIPGIHGANARVGPPLDAIGERSFVGGVLANTPDNMIRWIQNPPAIDPKTAMPNVGVTEPDARDIAAYLYTLR